MQSLPSLRGFVRRSGAWSLGACLLLTGPSLAAARSSSRSAVKPAEASPPTLAVGGQHPADAGPGSAAASQADSAATSSQAGPPSSPTGPGSQAAGPAGAASPTGAASLTGGAGPLAGPATGTADAGAKTDAAAGLSGATGALGPPAAGPGTERDPPLPLAPVPQIREEPLAAAGPVVPAGKGKRAKATRAKVVKTVLTDIVLESQNHSQGIARRYAQLLAAGRYDEARLMHEDEGGRRPDWSSLRAVAQAHNELHGSAKDVEQHLVTWNGAELLTFFFTAHYTDGSELPIRVSIDHNGHVSGAGVGSEVVPATRQRYSRYDSYKPKNQLFLPFYGTWTVSNASPGPGNGHYLNANQRFAIDFYITQEVESGKRRSYRERGKQNADYFAYGKDVLAPADGTVVMVVDGIPDNKPGQVDIYYRLGNSVVISLGSGEFVHLCHLQPGSMQVRVGDKLTRGQVVAKCGNSGNSTVPHLHFQLSDGPLVSHAASLPAYFSGVHKDGVRLEPVLPLSGDRLTQPPPKAPPAAISSAPPPSARASEDPQGN